MPIEKTLEILKSYSKQCNTLEKEKKVIRIYNQDYTDYEFGCVINQILNDNTYEVYLYYGVGKDKIVSNLLCKFFDEEDLSIDYFDELSKICNDNSLENLIEICEKATK